MTIAPWARLTTFMIPKIRVWPEAISAYTPPVSTPRIRPWIRACILLPPGCAGAGAASRARRHPRLVSPAPVRLGVDGCGPAVAGREDRHQLAVLPLDQVETAARGTGGVPAEVAQDRRPGAAVQRADDGVVVDLSGGLGDGLDQLAGGVRLGGTVVDGVGGAAVRRQVRR